MGQTIRCPQCNAAYAMKPEYAGKQLKCKKCERKFVIPAPAPNVNNMAELLDEIPLATVRETPPVSRPQVQSQAPLPRPSTPQKSWAERNPIVTKVALPVIIMGVLGLVLPRFGLQLRVLNRAQQQSSHNEHLQNPETMIPGVCIALGTIGALVAGFALRKQPQVAFLAVAGSFSALGAAYVASPYSGIFPTKKLSVAASNQDNKTGPGNGTVAPVVPDNPDPHVFEELLAALKSEDRSQLKAAAHQLARTKPTHLRKEISAALESHLDDSDPDVRSECLAGFSAWCDGDPVPTLIHALEDKSPGVSGRAIVLLVPRKDPRATAPVASLLTGPNVALVVGYLKQIGPASETEVLKYADNPDPAVRRWVIDLLGSVATEKGIAKLREFATSDDATIRSQATRALANLGNTLQSPPGSNRFSTSSPTASGKLRNEALPRHSIDAEEASPNDVNRLARQLQSNNLIERRKAVDILLAANPSDVDDESRQSVVAAFRTAVQTWQGESQRKAVLGLARWDGKNSVPDLLPLLTNRSPFIREAVFTAIGPLKDPRAAVPVAERLSDPFDCNKAITCLRQMGTASEDGLLAAATSDNPKVLSAAITLMADVGTDQCLPTLRTLTRNSNPSISVPAKAAIKRIMKRKQESREDSGE